MYSVSSGRWRRKMNGSAGLTGDEGNAAPMLSLMCAVGMHGALRGLSTRFHLCHTHGTVYYQHMPHQEQPPAGARRPVPTPARPGTSTRPWSCSARNASSTRWVW